MQVYGVLEVIGINSILFQKVCLVCKATCPILGVEGFCFACNSVVQVQEIGRLEGRITQPDRSSVCVTLSGLEVDRVLGLLEPFTVIYSRSVLEAKDILGSVKRIGNFVLNHVGHVMSFSPDDVP